MMRLILLSIALGLSWAYAPANSDRERLLTAIQSVDVKELRAAGFKVNSVSPGYFATDLGGLNAPTGGLIPW